MLTLSTDNHKLWLHKQSSISLSPEKKRILLPAVSALKHQNTENKIPRNVVGFVCIVDESDNLPLSTKWVK